MACELPRPARGPLIDESVDRLGIEGYLHAIRRELGALDEAEVSDIVLELRSHLLDKSASEGEWAAIAALGRPQELASLYLSALGDRKRRFSCIGAEV